MSPEDADRLLVRPLEREFRDLEGLDELRSIAYLGGARISLEFDVEFDRDVAHALLRERLQVAKSKLPDGLSQPKIQEVNISLFPLMLVTLSGSVPDAELMRYARTLRDDLEGMSSIASATIIGERDETLEIILDPLVLESYSLDTAELLNIVRQGNRAVAAGAVDSAGGHLVLSVPGLFVSVEDLLGLPIRATPGSMLTLGDVATVRRTLEDRQSLARLDGKPALAISVTKRIGENVIETIEALRVRVRQTAQGWPAGIKTDFSQDRSWRIRTRIAELRNSLISAVALVMIIVIATLGLRSGILVGLAIPGSFLLALLALAALGISINTAVLYAFVMSVGLLVDGAIVVVENAERLIRTGIRQVEAYIYSVRMLCLPVATSTATTLAAFLPLLFWPGVIGEYLKFLPLTVLLTLASSLVMALLFIPVLGATLVGPGNNASTSGQISATLPASSWLTRAYLYALAQALGRPAWVVVGAVGLLIWSVWIYERHGKGVEFLPEIEPVNAVVQVRARGELSFVEKKALALEVEKIALEYSAFRSVLLSVGDLGKAGGRTSTDVIAELWLEFKDWHTHRPGNELLQELKARSEAISGVRIEVRPQGAGPTGGKPIQLDVTGEDPRNLDQAVRMTRHELQRTRGVKDVEDSLPAPGIEWSLAINRAEAARYGVNLARAGQYAQLVTKGLKLGTARPPDSDEDLDIIVRFPEQYRSLTGLAAIRLQGNAGTVPLDQFSEIRPKPRAGAIERINGQRARRVVADVEPNLPKDERLGDLMRGIEGWALGAALPDGTQVSVRGEDEDREQAREFLLRAFAAALFLIALILVVQFNSFYSAFLILFAIVLSTIGVRLGLLFIDQPFGIVMSGIGVIALAGIVVNNNIILVSTYARELEGGLDPFNALLTTGRIRLRPVLLTSVTTIAGLVPLVFRVDIDYVERTVAVGAPTSQYWVQMSSAVVFGLAFATVLTLFIIPAALMLRANLQAGRARERASERETGRAESIAAIFATHGTPVGFAALTAIVAAWVFIPELVAMRVTDIVSKQIFEQPPSRWFQALERASFWSLIVLGAAYAYWKNAHVRVDIVRERLSQRGKAWVEIIGFFVLLLPVCAVVIIGGWGFVASSFVDEERSGALLGSPTQWIFKAMMLVCYAQLAWLGGYVTWRNIRFLRGKETGIFPPEPGAHPELLPESPND